MKLLRFGMARCSLVGPRKRLHIAAVRCGVRLGVLALGKAFRGVEPTVRSVQPNPVKSLSQRRPNPEQVGLRTSPFQMPAAPDEPAILRLHQRKVEVQIAASVLPPSGPLSGNRVRRARSTYARDG